MAVDSRQSRSRTELPLHPDRLRSKNGARHARLRHADQPLCPPPERRSCLTDNPAKSQRMTMIPGKRFFAGPYVVGRPATIKVTTKNSQGDRNQNKSLLTTNKVARRLPESIPTSEISDSPSDTPAIDCLK